MSRELKFRAWNKKEKFWGDASTLYLRLDSKKMAQVLFDKLSISGINDNEDIIIEQYTGLKDKNGKEIYEGDIVRHSKTVGEIKFDEIKDSDCTYYYIGWVIEYDRYSTASLYEDNNYVEVIGNIHEDPELLKGE